MSGSPLPTIAFSEQFLKLLNLSEKEAYALKAVFASRCERLTSTGGAVPRAAIVSQDGQLMILNPQSRAITHQIPLTGKGTDKRRMVITRDARDDEHGRQGVRIDVDGDTAPIVLRFHCQKATIALFFVQVIETFAKAPQLVSKLNETGKPLFDEAAQGRGVASSAIARLRSSSSSRAKKEDLQAVASMKREHLESKGVNIVVPPPVTPKEIEQVQLRATSSASVNSPPNPPQQTLHAETTYCNAGDESSTFDSDAAARAAASTELALPVDVTKEEVHLDQLAGPDRIRTEALEGPPSPILPVLEAAALAPLVRAPSRAFDGGALIYKVILPLNETSMDDEHTVYYRRGVLLDVQPTTSLDVNLIVTRRGKIVAVDTTNSSRIVMKAFTHSLRSAMVDVRVPAADSKGFELGQLVLNSASGESCTLHFDRHSVESMHRNDSVCSCLTYLFEVLRRTAGPFRSGAIQMLNPSDHAQAQTAVEKQLLAPIEDRRHRIPEGAAAVAAMTCELEGQPTTGTIGTGPREGLAELLHRNRKVLMDIEREHHRQAKATIGQTPTTTDVIPSQHDRSVLPDRMAPSPERNATRRSLLFLVHTICTASLRRLESERFQVYNASAIHLV